MKKKLRSILLVDDNPFDNKYHRIILEEMNVTEQIEEAQNGEDALQFLTKAGQSPPELILLDINMPRVNGWEFLDQYRKLHLSQKAKVVIMILTTSSNPDDIEKARQIKEVNGFETKPLNHEIMEDILAKNFSDYL